jgi:hypothetical protein
MRKLVPPVDRLLDSISKVPTIELSGHLNPCNPPLEACMIYHDSLTRGTKPLSLAWVVNGGEPRADDVGVAVVIGLCKRR